MAFIADFGDKSVVSVEVGMEVAAKGVGVLGAEVGLDTAQGEVHHGGAAGGRCWNRAWWLLGGA